MRDRHRGRRWGLVGALVAVTAFTAQSSSHADDDFYPGLPAPDGDTSEAWGGAAQGGLSYAKRAKQWVRTPDAMVTFMAGASKGPTTGDIATGQQYDSVINARAVFVSPDGAPANYGYLPPMTVRSVGFGLMPVEATVQVSQRREDDHPIPAKLQSRSTTYLESAGVGGTVESLSVYEPAVVTDAFDVQILKVVVDGVDLGLTGGCRTVTPAPVTLSGKGLDIAYPTEYPGKIESTYAARDPDTWWHPVLGGTLKGTMTIPPFTGCTTVSGDDLSALMTLSVSGPDNPVSARAGWPCYQDREGTTWPVAPGHATPKDAPDDWYYTLPDGSHVPGGCPGTKKMPYPARAAD